MKQIGEVAESGLRYLPRKQAKGQLFRGFESHPHRQIKEMPKQHLFFCVVDGYA